MIRHLPFAFFGIDMSETIDFSTTYLRSSFTHSSEPPPSRGSSMRARPRWSRPPNTADPKKKAARKRQRRARAITRRNRK